jgi:type II secretory ATPase GspE/PulE/Tfp pilus assembly ATPase PilB-like protein/CheY-like chemotaxis protein
MNTTTNHWLVRAAVRNGVAAAADVRIKPGMPVSDIWEAITRVAGIAEPELAAKAAAGLRMQVAKTETRDARAARLVPDKLAKANRVVPLRETDRQLVVATADPMNFDAEQALAFASGRNIVFELMGPRELERVLREAYPAGDELDELLASVDDTLADAVRVIDDQAPESVQSRELQAMPIVKLTNLILSEAIREDASDIHIEPGGAGGVVRFRVDGVLRQFMQLPLQAMTRVNSRIKVLAQMDIADRVRPQDGRARVHVAGREYDLRVSTVPVGGSEKAVIRVLYPKTAERLDQINLPERELGHIRKLLSFRDGIVVVTGPTGSGKTTTLYAALRELATGKVNITTVEDPVEYELSGITQIQVETKRGVTFASALRAILRQDPDVLLVGEIRDQETATVALQAALTGHLVLATLHTNDAATAVSRLIDLGLDPKNVANALRGALAQRLLRRVCPDCVRTITELNPEEERLAEQFGARPVVRAIGCDRCAGTGYRGRIAVVEVLSSSTRIEEAISRSATALEIRRAATAAGMRGLVDVALEHVKNGVTTLQEVERVLGESEAKVGPATTAVDDMPPGPHVLVVDDDEVSRDLTSSALEEAGMRVTQATDGVEALELIRDNTFALLVLDLDMPRMDGTAVLRRLRSNLSTASLPVIILTADRDAEIAVMEQGADDYMPKPLEPLRLVMRVKAVLRRKSL